MLSSNAPFTEQGFAALIRDIERHELLLSGSRQGDMGTSTGTNLGPLPADQTTDGDGVGGSPVATLADIASSLNNLTLTGAAVSLKGRSVNTQGVVGDIVASANGKYLRRSGDILTFASPVWQLASYSILSSSPFTVPANVFRITAVLVGGGGGQHSSTVSAGFVAASSGGAVTLEYLFAGGCGGAGASKIVFLDVTPGASITFSIGTGGTTSSTPTNGGSTTLTSNGITYTANGGTAGSAASLRQYGGQGGRGGVASFINASEIGISGPNGNDGSMSTTGTRSESPATGLFGYGAGGTPSNNGTDGVVLVQYTAET